MQIKRSSEELIIQWIYLGFNRSQHLQAATAAIEGGMAKTPLDAKHR
ncbi:hypothetical protein [Nostoc sp. ATCC 53789]|nr:hypothetical protein [Nostoc sp. ATCC 53789]QHG18529.1 hypothetical protein GJB62_22830 [Nostoc sp. ATCC 53789]